MKKLFTFSILIFLLSFHLRAAVEVRVLPITDSLRVMRLDSAVVETFIDSNLNSKGKEEDLRAFYSQRHYRFAWFSPEGLTEQAHIFWNNYEYYLNYSKDSSLYSSDLDEAMERYQDETNLDTSAVKPGETELALTKLFFDFTRIAHMGRVDPRKMRWHIPRDSPDILSLLIDFVDAKGNAISEAIPMNRQYELMRKKILFFEKLKMEREFAEISPEEGKVYRKGDSSSVIREVRERLIVLGDLTSSDTSAIYDQGLELAVIRFQKRHGLKEDGIIGPAVMHTINLPLDRKIEKLLLNLERMRWMPDQGEGKRIFVNIPEFKLHVYEGETDVLSMDVVVGKEANRTVIFSDEVQHVVFSPYWNIPESIVKNEILPGIERNPKYLSRHNMEIVGKRNGLPIVRQKPGRRNSLGRVKFIFPNRYSIYLHDTPAKGLFERTERAFSHGCIRVAEPFELAKYLLKEQPGWTDTRIRSAMHSQSEKWVALDEKVPVYIAYFTAWVDQAGELNFRPDIYGHDKNLSAQLF